MMLTIHNSSETVQCSEYLGTQNISIHSPIYFHLNKNFRQDMTQ